MTKKDYVLIAKALLDAKASKEVCTKMAKALHEDNTVFDDANFFIACGYSSN